MKNFLLVIMVVLGINCEKSLEPKTESEIDTLYVVQQFDIEKREGSFILQVDTNNCYSILKDSFLTYPGQLITKETSRAFRIEEVSSCLKIVNLSGIQLAIGEDAPFINYESEMGVYNPYVPDLYQYPLTYFLVCYNNINYCKLTLDSLVIKEPLEKSKAYFRYALNLTPNETYFGK